MNLFESINAFPHFHLLCDFCIWLLALNKCLVFIHSCVYLFDSILFPTYMV